MCHWKDENSNISFSVVGHNRRQLVCRQFDQRYAGKSKIASLDMASFRLTDGRQLMSALLVAVSSQPEQECHQFDQMLFP